MKNYVLAFLCCFIAIGAYAAGELPYGYPHTDRTKVSLNADWKFHLGDEDAAYYTTSTNDDSWEEVSIPHVLKLTDLNLDGCQDDVTQPTFHRTVGWYRKDVFVPKSDKKVYIEFEGVQQVTTLWVNGREVGVHAVGGYTPFIFDITDFVKRGAQNQVTILADNRQNETTPPDPDSKDYVIFGGIYRDLYLVEKNRVHITSNLDSQRSGVTITTPSVDLVNGNATITIKTEVKNESSKSQDMTLVQRVVDAEGNVVLKMSESFTIAAGALHHSSHSGGIDEDVKFWSIEYPYLYRVNTTLYNGDGEAIDVVDNRLGLRKIELDAEDGLKLNGKKILLVGFNRHQNYGFIGDAAPNSLQYRDMAQLKKMGVNSVRTSHYPQDDELIKACDELGILVYEEAPTWHGISMSEEWYDNLHKAAQAMIRNHKNSPSVFAWGAGINHRGVVAEMQFLAKEEDPTRLTGSQNSRWTGWQTSSWSDFYANMNYAASIWEREEPQAAMEGNAGPAALAPYFREDKRIGMMSWVSAAYYTFSHATAGLYDRTHNYGVLDVFRYPRNLELMWYPSQMKLNPYIFIKDSWTEDLKMLTVYSNATEVELFVNGSSRGRFLPSNALIYNGLTHAPFEIKNFDYEAGEIRVVGYREGEAICEATAYTPSKATSLRLFADEYGVGMKADGNDIVIVHAEVVDKNGMILRDYVGEVKFEVSGDATIVGDEIGEGFNPSMVMVGAASALIRAGKSAGDIEVKALCSGLQSSTITLKSEEYTTDIIAQDSYPIYDRERVMVDIGSDKQLNQFGWTPMQSDDQRSAEIIIPYVTPTNHVAGHLPPASNRGRAADADGYKFKISTTSTDGVLQWVGGMSAIGRNNNLFSDGVLCSDSEGLTFVISDLPAGDYEVKSYHHAPIVPKENLKKDLPAELKSGGANQYYYSESISVSIDGQLQTSGVDITTGNNMQYEDITEIITKFTIDKDGESMELNFRGDDDNSAVWINGFEFSRML
ncbi:MAG: glycoside hydrolase family 2 TIM barrel-domain containing protein [Rikenellaceae bacterium]